MKKFSEFRDKLTSAQAKNYSVITSLILTLPVTILLIIHIWPRFQTDAIPMSIIITAFLFATFYLFFDYFIFKSHDKYWKEKHISTKQRVITEYELTKETYTKVKYDYRQMLKNTSDRDMLNKLLIHSAYTFYVKLTDEEKIELIVKDKDENLIYTYIYTNFIYLETYFEKID